MKHIIGALQNHEVLLAAPAEQILIFICFWVLLRRVLCFGRRC